MPYLTHRFETTIRRHYAGTLAYTVVLLDPDLLDGLPLREHPRLRIKADVGEMTVKGLA